MKRLLTWTLVMTAAALILCGCDDPDSNEPDRAPDISGVYDMNLAPEAPANSEYTITVEQGGLSGNAEISISGPLSYDTATVIQGSSIAIGGCDMWVAFSAAGGIDLAAGDVWRIRVANGVPGDPLPGGTIYSTVDQVSAGGQDCAQTLCDGSVLGSGVPGPTKGLIAPPSQGLQWHSVQMGQNNAQVSASVAEQQVLSLYLSTPYVSIGNTATLTYRRALAADGAGGDFWRTVVTNGTDILDAEYLYGASVTSADTVVTLAFVPKSVEIRIDFIAGLSESGEYALLDDISVAGGIGFSEGFEDGPGADCGPGGLNAGSFESRRPFWTVGWMCVTTQGALSGSYSERWEGGSTRQVTGSIISTSSLSGISSFVGGGLGGLLGGSSGFTGIFLEAWEPDWTGYFTTFSVARQSASSLAGTFKGESQNHTCVERGQVTGSIHTTQVTDLSSSYWVIRIEGQGVECDPALAAGNTLEFGDTLTTVSGDTIDLIQIGGLFLALEDPVDMYGNTLGLNGTVGGEIMTMVLSETGGLATANGVGVIQGAEINGALTGQMAFDYDSVAGRTRVCDLTDATFHVDLMPR